MRPNPTLQSITKQIKKNSFKLETSWNFQWEPGRTIWVPSRLDKIQIGPRFGRNQIQENQVRPRLGETRFHSMIGCRLQPMRIQRNRADLRCESSSFSFTRFWLVRVPYRRESETLKNDHVDRSNSKATAKPKKKPTTKKTNNSLWLNMEILIDQFI